MKNSDLFVGIHVTNIYAFLIASDGWKDCNAARMQT